MRLEDHLLLLQVRLPRLAAVFSRLSRLARDFRQVGRRSMQRFTPVGKLLLGFYTVSLIFVVDTRATMNYQIFALLLALLLLCFFLAWRVRLPQGTLETRRILPRASNAGVPLEYDLVLSNHSGNAQRGLQVFESLEPEVENFDHSQKHGGAPLRVRLTWRGLLSGNGETLRHQAAIPPLEKGSRTRIRVSAPAPRRGVLRFSQSALATPDPLGVFRSFTPLPAGESLLVLPRCFPVPRLVLPGGRRHQPGGLRMASHVGEEGEFASLREYRRGDPLRHIHWRSWARHAKPIVKEFQEEFFTRHGLLLDTFPDPLRTPTARDAAAFEAAVSVAASFASAPRDQDTLLDLLFVGDTAHCLTVGRGLGSEEQLLEILAGVTPRLDDQESGDKKGFAWLAALVSEHAPLISGCVCVLLGWDAPRQDLVRELEAGGVETLVLVLPCSDRPLPETGELDGRRMAVLHPDNLEQELAGL